MFVQKLKLYSVVIIAALSLLLINCAAVISPLPVGIYSNAKFPLDFETGYNGDLEYKILGIAEGKATATSIFGLLATGDASIATAYQNAINQFPEADCLIEIKIDYATNSILGLFASMTTIVKGKAIQFQQSSYKAEKQKEDIEHQKAAIIKSQKSESKIDPSMKKGHELISKKPDNKELPNTDSKIDTTIKKLETVDLTKQITDEELISWKKMIKNGLNNKPYSNLWKSYSARNSINMSKGEWVNSLTKDDYHKYILSKIPFDKWLEKKLED